MAIASLCLLLAWCAVQSEKPPELLGMRINGNPMIVPVSYIPRYQRGWYGQGMATKGLYILAQWTDGTMQPFVSPESNTPIWFTYHDKYSILLRNVPNETFPARRKLATFYASIRLPNRHADGWRYGLLRLVHNDVEQREREHALSTFAEQDLYLYPSHDQIETMITCDPDFFPNPYTERAYALQKRGKFVINPMCSHDMFMHDLKNTQIEISYFRVHLPRWREIEEAVRALLQSFKPLPGSLHYEQEQDKPPPVCRSHALTVAPATKEEVDGNPVDIAPFCTILNAKSPLG
ncbi:hypothetical protein [Janthinobacterium aquaticum]|uniref:hypothetical protein n=1 Tax=Janthinobacterium sp. FT58W TaxID=2654254 RepID=UPI00126502A3|nr:hypothetical protein [Janthinobacterium sp. FT58W]KAB8042126.1 hypothetical protein GCM43_15930 [Janthinobacterium sp. FT58W]